jgi:hypothetical protein
VLISFSLVTALDIQANLKALAIGAVAVWHDLGAERAWRHEDVRRDEFLFMPSPRASC